MKLLSKERQGGKVMKTHDTAQTPYQRVLASPEVSEQAKQALRRQFRRLDPVGLLGKLKQLQDQLRQYVEVPACALDECEQPPVVGAPSLMDLAVTVGNHVVVSGQSMAGGDGACRPVTVAVVSPGTGAPRQARLSRSERMEQKKPKRKGRYHLAAGIPGAPTRMPSPACGRK